MTFLKQYHGARLEDDIMQNSADVRSFSRAFRKYLKEILPDCRIVGYNLGHYDVSSFLEKDGQYIYLDYSIPRHGQPIDVFAGLNGFDSGAGYVLIRGAKDEKDYTGLSNHFCALANIAEAAEKLFSGAWHEKAMEGGRV